MKKYGLNLRVNPPQQKKQPIKPPSALAPGFGDEDDDDVGKEIARQATKKKVLKDIEEQHKKALEEDPSVFDYDGVYDQMKEAAIRPLVQDRQERKSKYIQTLMEKAKERERQHEIVFERKLAKERSQEDHLFADKDKFVTSAYKKKLAEQEKWMEEERLSELRELKDDVTKKKDISDFYFNLTKNVAFGAKAAEEPVRQAKQEEEVSADILGKEVLPPWTSARDENANAKSEVETGLKGKVDGGEEASVEEKKQEENHKRSEDAVAAAKQRFLARKRAKEN